MNFVRLLPVLLSFVLVAAHFSRNDITPLVYVSLALPFLLLVRRPWVPRMFQVLLILGGLEWLRRLVVLASERHAAGESWVRLAVILGAVAAFTFLSALVFRCRALRERYGLGTPANSR
jgi:hypothetical protein